MFNIFKKFSGIIILVIMISGVAAVGAYLFFGEKAVFFLESRDLFGRQVPARSLEEVLRIGYVFAPKSLDPVLFDPVTRNYLVDIYEGLVLTDKNLNIESGLAVSWGMVEPTVWEFRLRPGVVFHNGQSLSAEDVIYSLERAMTDEKSQLKDLLSTVNSVEKVGDSLVRVILHVPDPLILSKLALVYIVPSDFKNFDTPQGTGPYKFVSRDELNMKLERNDEYWGKLPAFNNVVLTEIRDKRDRIKALEDGWLDILANLPPSAACAFDERYMNADGCSGIDVTGLQIKSIPSLEVSFVLFNMNNKILKNKIIRNALSKVFDRQVFVDMAFGFSKPATQFFSSGVFGFNPQIQVGSFNMEDAKKEFEGLFNGSFSRLSLTFDYPISLDPIAQYVKSKFFDLGIDVVLNPLDDLALQNKIREGDSEMFFLGWKSELGDAGDFLQSVVHTRDMNKGFGLYNGMNYSNENVDVLIENTRENIDTESRLSQLQEVSRIIVEEDVIGVPLFESETIFAFSDNIYFDPRVDGFIYASDIK